MPRRRYSTQSAAATPSARSRIWKAVLSTNRLDGSRGRSSSEARTGAVPSFLDFRSAIGSALRSLTEPPASGEDLNEQENRRQNDQQVDQTTDVKGQKPEGPEDQQNDRSGIKHGVL